MENEPKINSKVVKNGFLIKKEIVFKIVISLIYCSNTRSLVKIASVFINDVKHDTLKLGAF